MNRNIAIFLLLALNLFINPLFAKELLNDSLSDSLKNIKIDKPSTNTKYNYQSFEKVAIPLRISEKISTKDTEMYDNRPLVFYVSDNVKFKGKTILQRGTKFTANVSTYMSRGMNGIPATLVIENFKSHNIDSKKLKGIYIKKGLNLTPLVLPIKWMLTPFPGVGTLTNFIVGGNATINPNDEIIIYYYPNW
ncbi:hypothetical protein IJ182_02015 [bacterium]|nr:hypothetical protein [bacterium]